jgi:hypothetical protein
VPRDSTVPSGTAPDIFASERYGAQHYDLPVASGRSLTVRLYFANQFDGTATAGQRVFNVAIDATTVLDHFDIVAAAGNKTGTMRAFQVTSDSDGVDIDLSNVTENALINGIEVIDNSTGGGTSSTGVLQRRAVDASGSPTGAATTANSTFDWSTVRGAFLVNGALYYGLSDGGLYSRTFNTTTGATGTPVTVNLYDDPDTGERIPFAIANLTGMFYDTVAHRVYYGVRRFEALLPLLHTGEPGRGRPDVHRRLQRSGLRGSRRDDPRRREDPLRLEQGRLPAVGHLRRRQRHRHPVRGQQ